MNICTARKFLAHRKILSGLAGLVLMAIPMSAAAGGSPDDIAAYQSAQYGQPYGQPMAPLPQYPGPSGSYARHNQLVAQLNYAEAQYNQARRSGNRQAAKYWRKDIKHLQRELSGRGHAEGRVYGAPAFMPPQQPLYAPPASAYAQPMQEYGPPPSPAYAQQPYPQAGYPPTGYPPAGYPQATAAPYVAPGYGAPGATGSTSGLSSLLGPLLGTGAAAPSGAPVANYPQAGYPTEQPAPSTRHRRATGSMGGLSSLLGPLLGGGSIP